MRKGLMTALSMLLVLSGCQQAMDQRAENAVAEEPSGTAPPQPDNAENMAGTDGANTAANAAENTAENAGASASGNTTAADGRVDCDAIRDLASPSDCAAFTAQARNIEKGLGAFNVPAAMTVRQPVEVRFAVGTVAAEAETIESASGGIIAKSIRVPTRIGRYMTATLAGSGFKIEPQGAAQRDLGASRSEVWAWDVTPQRKGKLDLLLTVSVEAADAQGKRTRVNLSTKTVPVEVAVSRADALRERAEQSAADAKLAADVSKAWAGFFTNLALAIVAFGGLLGAIWYFKIKKPADPPAASPAAPPPPPKDGPKP